MRKRLISNILAAVMLFGVISGALPGYAHAAQFTDTTSHWAKDTIARWVEYGVLKGVSDTVFAPNRSITRAEYLTMINRAFGATQTANISQFVDVPTNSWYYNEIAKAVQMGTTNGTTSTTMSPLANISRQEAAVILARALGISDENISSLQNFRDGEAVSAYARPHVAAFVSRGYLKGYNGNLNPGSSLTRAEAVTMLDNIFKVVVRTSGTLNSNGSVLVQTAGVSLTGTVNGDLILADGVGRGDVTLNAVTITGRLVIRGGGENSIIVNNSTSQGVFLQNPSGRTRLALNDSDIGSIAATTGLILEGDQAASIHVPAEVAVRPVITMKDGTIDSFSASSPTTLQLSGGTVNNAYFYQGADGSAADLASGAEINYLRIDAPSVTVSGTGTLGELSIGASGANVAMAPRSWYIDDNLSAVINGKTQWGKVSSSAGSNVSRTASNMQITQNSGQTGGSGIRLGNSTGVNANGVSVSQTSNTRVPLSTRNSRAAYWVGFFIPSPENSSASVTLYYNFDGVSTSMSVATTTKDSRRGIELYIPVARYEDDSDQGAIDTNVYITWNASYYETINFSGILNLQALSTNETNTLVSYYRNATFRGYNGTQYSGAEAIRRLLLSDNPLGLSTRGFKSLSAASMSNITSRLNNETSLFTSRAAIQERLLVALAGEGIFYAINRAVSAEQIKGYIEFAEFGSQIGIDDETLSKYFTLSQVGRLSVARTVLLSRGTDYPNEAALRTVFLTAVDTVRDAEAKLIAELNAARTVDEIKKLLENKTNMVLLDIVTDADPYKSLTNEQKNELMAEMLAGKPYANLDAVKSSFNAELNTFPSGGSGSGGEEKVISVSSFTPAITVEVGSSALIEPVVTTNQNVYTDQDAVTYSSDKANIAIVDPQQGVVDARAKGTAKVTLTSKLDDKKTSTVTVNVVDPIIATAISLSSSQLEIQKDGTANIRATLTPVNSTAPVVWGSDDESIATVEGTGTNAVIRGHKVGFTRIVAVTTGSTQGLSAACTVFVVPAGAGVTVYPETLLVGIGSSRDITAIVTPTTASDRSVTWKTSDPKIATVNAGKVTGVSKGTVMVTATSVLNPQLSATCTVTVDETVRDLILDKTGMTLYTGGLEIIEAMVVPPGNNEKVNWSYDSRYVKVTEISNGKVSVEGVSAGKITLTASAMTADGVTITAGCQVEVLSTTVKVTLSKATLSLNVEESQYLTCSFTPATILNKAVAWTTSDAAVATVDQNGKITGVAAGTAMITAVAQANQSTSLTCMVTVKPVTVKLNKTSLSMEAEKTEYLTVTFTPTTLQDKSVTWSSRNSLIAEVDADGKITAGAPGTTYVDAVAAGQTLSCMVTVKPITVKLNKTSLSMNVEEVQYLSATFTPATLSNRKVTWSSSSDKVATVDENGKVTAGVSGTAIITAVPAADPDTKLTCTVTVKPITVKLNKTSMSMAVDETQFLSVTFTPASLSNKTVIWSVNPEKGVLEVDKNGMLTAIAPGDAVVYAAFEADPTQTLSCAVSVRTVALSSISIPSAYNLTLKNQTELLPTILPDNATIKSIKWTSTDENIIQAEDTRLTGVATTWRTIWLDGEGNIVAEPSDPTSPPPGYRSEKRDFPLTLWVTVTDFNNNTRTAYCDVSVTEHSFDDVDSVYINLATWVFPVGHRQNLEVKFNGDVGDVTNRKVTWTSSNPTVASVDQSGYLMCNAPGETTIHVLSEAGAKTDEKTIVVANVGLTALNPVTGLSSDLLKGAWMELGLGETAQLSAASSTVEATDKRLTWRSEQTDIARVTGSSTTVEGVTINTGTVTAVAPGWAKIVIQPTQTSRHGTPNTSSDLANVLLAASKLTLIDTDGDPNKGKYRSPNRDILGNYTYYALSDLIGVPLVMKNEIIEGGENTNNTLWVYVPPADGAAQPTFAFTDEPGKTIAVGESIPLNALLSYAYSGQTVTWSVSGTGGASVSGAATTTAGKATATVTGLLPGTYTVTASVAIAEIRGTNNALLQAAATLDATYVITVTGTSAAGVSITGVPERPPHIYKDETLQLAAVVTPADASFQTVKWSSGNPSIMTVDENTGLVTAVGVGPVTITATVNDPTLATKPSASVLLIAETRPPVTAVTLSGPDISDGGTIARYDTFALTAVVDKGAKPTLITWTIKDEATGAPVTDALLWMNGGTTLSDSLTAMKLGTYTIQVEVDGILSDIWTITVATTVQAPAVMSLPIAPFTLPVTPPAPEPVVPPAPEPTDVKLRTTAGVAVGDKLTLVPYLTPYNASTAGLTWKSSVPAVATVENGVVTGGKAGSTKITVTDATGKLSAVCTVTVKAKNVVSVTSITLSKPELTVGAGKAANLTVSYRPTTATIRGVTWSSSDETVARVEPNGRVVGVSTGTAVITAVSDTGGCSASCIVTVTVPVTAVTLSAKTLTMKAGGTDQLTAVVTPDDATNRTVTFKSSAPAVVSVDAEGNLTAKKAGTATITATADGKTATCKITVKK